MRPIRALATALLVGSVALAGCATHPTTSSSGPSAAPPVGAAPTTSPPAQPTQPHATKPTPPSTADAAATALAFMRREVGMTNPVAGAFHWTGAHTGQVDIRATIADAPNPQRGPIATVSLRRLASVWYVLGVRSDAIRVVDPLSQDPIHSPLGVMALSNDRVRVRVTQDRYGKDTELGSGSLTNANPTFHSPELEGTIAFGQPSAATGSVVLTTTSGHNGQVWAATVVRVRFASGPPPQILGVRLHPQLPQQDGWLQLPDGSGTLTVRVTARHADRARLVVTPTGTGTAWYARVVATDTTAGNGLRLVCRYQDIGHSSYLHVVVVGPGGVTTSDLYSFA